MKCTVQIHALHKINELNVMREDATMLLLY